MQNPNPNLPKADGAKRPVQPPSVKKKNAQTPRAPQDIKKSIQQANTVTDGEDG